MLISSTQQAHPNLLLIASWVLCTYKVRKQENLLGAQDTTHSLKMKQNQHAPTLASPVAFAPTFLMLPDQTPTTNLIKLAARFRFEIDITPTVGDAWVEKTIRASP